MPFILHTAGKMVGKRVRTLRELSNSDGIFTVGTEMTIISTSTLGRYNLKCDDGHIATLVDSNHFVEIRNG